MPGDGRRGHAPAVVEKKPLDQEGHRAGLAGVWSGDRSNTDLEGLSLAAKKWGIPLEIVEASSPGE